MQIKHLPNKFVKARKVLQKIEENGFKAYFVGGSVRDTILKLPIHDVDMATSAYPAEIKQIFKRTIDTGIEHGTITVMYDHVGFEITTFRTESGYQDYRRPDKVTFVRSLKEDLKRRDFTINALAMRENGDVIDLFDGINDLHKHLIKAVGNPKKRFHEDALRMMRAVRFASQLNFEIDSSTFLAIKENSYLLKKIAIERINVEFIKMMLGIAPGRGIRQMLDTKLFENVPFFNNYLNELSDLVKLPISDYLKNEVQVWSLFALKFSLDDFKIRKMMQAWKCSNKLIEDTVAVVTGSRAIINNGMNKMILYKIGIKNIENACSVVAVFGKKTDFKALNFEYSNLPIKNKSELKLNGNDLIKAGIKPGPKIGEILKKFEKEVVLGNTKNQKNDLTKRLNEVKNG